MSGDTSLLFQERRNEGMIKIMADNLDSCGLLKGHFVGILADEMLEANPLFLETTVCLKKKMKRYTFELISANKEKYPPNITTDFF